MKDIQDKENLFNELLKKVREIVNGGDDWNRKLSSICQLLKVSVPYYDWVGFYIADLPKMELYLGPFSGEETEHTRIPYGRGICGQAIQRKETFVVPDVSKETNYLSCSPKVKSEIVVPIFTDEECVAELDIDSHTASPFTEEDRGFLEKVCGIVSGLF